VRRCAGGAQRRPERPRQPHARRSPAADVTWRRPPSSRKSSSRCLSRPAPRFDPAPRGWRRSPWPPAADFDDRLVIELRRSHRRPTSTRSNEPVVVGRSRRLPADSCLAHGGFARRSSVPGQRRLPISSGAAGHRRRSRSPGPAPLTEYPVGQRPSISIKRQSRGRYPRGTESVSSPIPSISALPQHAGRRQALRQLVRRRDAAQSACKHRESWSTHRATRGSTATGSAAGRARRRSSFLRALRRAAGSIRWSCGNRPPFRGDRPRR